MRRWRNLLGLILWLAACAAPGAEKQNSVDVEVWTKGQTEGGWGGFHNATVAKDPEGVILKAGGDGYYGSAFRSTEEVDLDRFPYFMVEVDKASGSFACKLINLEKKDKQVIFSPTPGDRVFLTHLPSQTGWSGRTRFTLGIYCHGAGKSLRVRRVGFLSTPTTDVLARWDQMRNLLFDASFELCKPGEPPLQCWHRCGSYIPADTPWRVVSEDPFHGRNCLRTTRPGLFFMQREIHSGGVGDYVFSVYLKAARSGHKARLHLVTYRSAKPFRTEPATLDVSVGKEWKRYQIAVKVPRVRNRGVLGPVDVGVESLSDGELLLDAMQFERSKTPSLFGCNRALLIYRPKDNLRAPLYPEVKEPPGPAAPPAAKTGRVRMKPLTDPPPAAGWPMTGAVALPLGASYDASTWRFLSSSGAPLPAQFRVLARWKQDGSIKAAHVIAEADGSKEWVLEYNSKKAAPAIENPKRLKGAVTVGKMFFITSLDGREFSNAERPASVRIEENGPIRAVIRVEGAHESAAGGQLLSYVARQHSYRCPYLKRIEYTWINTNASPSVAVSSIAMKVPLDPKRIKGAAFFGADGKAIPVDPAKGASLLQCDEKKNYFYEIRSGGAAPRRFEGKAEGRVRVDLGDEAVDLRVADWRQNHPMEIALDENGITVFFWPPHVKAVELTRGMAKTYIVDVWHRPKDKAPSKMTGAVQLAASPSELCRSGVFGGEILPNDGSPFPIFEKAVASKTCLGHINPDYLDGHDCYGQFNFGDTLGDGGWGNLETQLGHAAWMRFIRTGEATFFAIAQAAARHYRDIDIDQTCGSTITHNPSHTLGGKSTSHAWIQGMLDHYLNTGERRSMEVALLHAEFLKGLPMDKLTAGGRTVTRVLDNLADLYMTTGDDELIARYKEVCDFQRKNLKEQGTKFPGLFQNQRNGVWFYSAGFPPWYGLCSLVKLYLATGDDEWRKFLAEEIACAMDPRVFKHSRPEFFSGNPLSDDQRIVRCLAEGAIGDRGCTLFPALAYGYRWTGKGRYLDIGMDTVYIAVISREYRDPLYVLAAVFLEQARQAGLGPEDEKKHYQAALDIMKRMAQPRLANPGFEDGTAHWMGWRVKSSTSLYWQPIRKATTRTDTTRKKEGKQSLHVVVAKPLAPGFSVPIESDQFILEKGKYIVEGWARSEGEVGIRVWLSVNPLTADADPVGLHARMADPDPEGWRRWRIEADVPFDSLGRLCLYVGRNTAASEGSAWFDGITVTRE